MFSLQWKHLVLAGAFVGAYLATPERLCAAPSTGERPLAQYQHRSWSVADGLPQAGTRSMVEAQDGYLWMTTAEGLARFDGLAFDVWDQYRDPAIRNHEMPHFLQAPDGTFWFGTHGDGVLRWQNGRFETFGREQGLPNDDVNPIARDAAGRIWVGTIGGGVAWFEGDRFHAAPPLPDLRIRSLAIGGDGRVWAGTGSAGLFSLQPGDTSWQAEAALAGIGIDAILPLADGTFWIGTDAGLFRLENGAPGSRTASPGPVREPVRALFEDRSGALWIGMTRGLARLSPGPGGSSGAGDAVERFPASDPLSTAQVLEFTEDRSGNIWIGTGSAGIHRLRAAPFLPYGPADGVTAKPAASVWSQREGTLLAIDDGLLRMEHGRFVADERGRHLEGLRPLTIYEARDGALWIGTSESLLRFAADGAVERWLGGRDYPGNWIIAIGEDAAGEIWVGAQWAGLLHLVREPGGTTRFEADGDHRDEWVQAIAFDGRRLVAGTRPLEIREPGQEVVRIGVAEGFREDPVTGLVLDPDGTIWASTNGAGLYRVRGREVVPFSSAEGFPNNHLLRLVDDGEAGESGALLASSNRGILRVTRAELNRHAAERAAGRIPRPLEMQIFDELDGMPSRELGPGVIGRDADGRLWFPTIEGFAVLDPKILEREPRTERPVVESIRADGALLSLAAGASRVEVPAATERLEIRFAAPTLDLPERVKFRYRLTGVDSNWVEATGRTPIAYTRPPAGDLDFVLVASDDTGRFAIGRGEARLRLAVAPTFFERLDVRIALGALAIALLASLHFGRTALLRRRERELRQLVDERTVELAEARATAESASAAKTVFLASMSHELRTPLHSLLGFADLMGRSGERDATDREHLRQIEGAGRHLRSLIEDVLELSRIESGEPPRPALSVFAPEALLRDVAALLAERASAKGLAFEVELGALPAAVEGDASKLRQILVNLTTNAIKFTAHGKVTLRAARAIASGAGDGDPASDSGRLRFEVEDTGPGIPAATAAGLFRPFVQAEAGTRSGEGVGLGLAISDRLARLLGGTIAILPTRHEGSGARFVVELPLPEADPARLAQSDLSSGTSKPVSTRRGPRHAVVVDDDDAARALLTALLERQGFAVTGRRDGQGVVALLAAGSFDLLVTDLHLTSGLPAPGDATPGDPTPEEETRNGAALVRAVRAELSAPGRRTPAILGVTASAFDRERAAFLAAGCDAILGKPFGEIELVATLARILRALPRLRVLVADDHAPSRDLLAALLTAEACDVTAVANGDEALAACRAARFDLVILDGRMPGRDGPATAAALRESFRREGQPDTHPLVALLSADDVETTRKAPGAAAADRILAKPLDAGRLVDLLAEVRGSHAAVAPTRAPEPGALDLDLAALERLAALDATVARELASRYLESAASEVAASRAALDAGDRRRWRAHLHDLRGSSLLVGARAVAERCADLETAANDLGDDVCRSGLAALQSELQSVAEKLADAGWVTPHEARESERISA